MMSVDFSFFGVMPKREEPKEPRERYSEFQRDLFNIARQELDPSSLLKGDQYTYVELIDNAIDKVDATVWQNTNLLISTYWTPEFDPDYSAFGPYIAHKCQLKCPSFDVCDAGSIAPFSALKVLSQYMTNDEHVQTACLLGFEQNTVPEAVNANVIKPDNSSSGMVFFTKPNDSASAFKAGMTVLDIDIVNEQQVAQKTFIPQQYLLEKLRQVRTGDQPVVLWVRRNTLFFKLFQYWNDVESFAAMEDITLRYLPANHTSMGLFHWFSERHADQPKTSQIDILLEEDAESLAMALLFCQQNGPSNSDGKEG